MIYLEKKLKEKAYAMFAERSITELSHPDDFRLILEAGAALQRDADFIEEIRDIYCIDEHKDAEEIRDALVKAAAERKLKPEPIPLGAIFKKVAEEIYVQLTSESDGHGGNFGLEYWQIIGTDRPYTYVGTTPFARRRIEIEGNPLWERV